VALDFYQKLKLVAPFKSGLSRLIMVWSSWENLISTSLNKKLSIISPIPALLKSNVFIERFNRTIEEEFIEANLEFLENTQEFNLKLVDYL